MDGLRAALKYSTYDVTDLLTTGENVVGAWLGDGWYRGRLGWYGGFWNIFGTRHRPHRPARDRDRGRD